MNTIKLTIAVDADTDPTKLGEAIAHVIEAVTASADLTEVAEH
jgi:hypothetical protein